MLSVEQAISEIFGKIDDSIICGAHLEMFTDHNHQATRQVPRALRGRSKKARMVARNGTACRWKIRMRGFDLDTMYSRNIMSIPFPPGNLHKNFLGL